MYAGNKSIGLVTTCFDVLPNTPSCVAFHALQANATLVAISNATIGDLSTASKYLLGITQAIGFTQLGTLKTFGYYLTTNRTLPHHAIGSPSLYDPQSDPSVVLVANFYCKTGCGGTSPSVEEDINLLRTIGQRDTILSEQTGGCFNGSVFLCNTQTISTTSCPNGSFVGCISSAVYLNYTGVTNGNTCTITNINGINPAPGCSWLENGVYPTVDSTKWFQRKHYLGFNYRQTNTISDSLQVPGVEI